LKYSLTIFFILPALISLGQEYEYDESDIYRSPIKKILNQFSVTFTTGYNSTNYKHDLSGFYLIQTATQQFIADDTGEASLPATYDVYTNWFNDPVLAQTVVSVDSFDVPFLPILDPVNNPLLLTDANIIAGDTLGGLSFSGRGWSIPLNLSFRYNFQKLRVGFGLSMEFHKVKSLKPNITTLGIRDYQPNFSSAFFLSYYGQIGYRFYDFWDYSFAAELNIGKNKLGKNFNAAAIDQGMFINFGISIEKNLSEYFRLILKPSYDFKSYNVNIPGLDKSIKHSNPAFNVHFGVSITFPEIPRSPIKSDHVQLKHVITDPQTGRYTEVRGQPIWKRQNPKVGENHRQLFRYKGRNKKKISPY